MDPMSLGVNIEKSFAPLPPEPNGRNKSMGTRDRIPPDPANSRHTPVEFSGTHHSSQINAEWHSAGLHLRMTETRGPLATKLDQHPPRHQSLMSRITKEEKGSTDHACRHHQADTGGEGLHRSTHSSMATGEVHQATAKQSCYLASTTCASSPPMMRHLRSHLLPIVVRWKGRCHCH
jgi:hypothetical protein